MTNDTLHTKTMLTGAPGEFTAIPAVVRAWGARLRVAREFAGMTQADLADELGFSQKAVSLIEQGRRKPSITFYLAACTYFVNRSGADLRMIGGD